MIINEIIFYRERGNLECLSGERSEQGFTFLSF